MKIQNLSFLVFVIGFIAITSGCLSVSVNSRWKIPNSDLSILIERAKRKASDKAYKRTLSLEENFSTKNKLEMAQENGEYSRANIYRTSDKTYLVKDFWNGFEVNTETKTLKKLDSVADVNGEFIGAFDVNENGGWRFIPAAERNEIPLGEKKLK